MIKTKLILSIAFSLLGLSVCVGQISPEQVRQRDGQEANTARITSDLCEIMEFGNVDWSDEMSRLDYLDSVLRNDLELVAYIIVYGGRRGDLRGDTEARIACIKDYMLNRRGVPADRITIMKGGYRRESTVEFWVAARSGPRPLATPTVATKDVRFSKGRIRNWRQRCNN